MTARQARTTRRGPRRNRPGDRSSRALMPAPLLNRKLAASPHLPADRPIGMVATCASLAA
jgi:hypothetical protein